TSRSPVSSSGGIFAIRSAAAAPLDLYMGINIGSTGKISTGIRRLLGSAQKASSRGSITLEFFRFVITKFLHYRSFSPQLFLNPGYMSGKVPAKSAQGLLRICTSSFFKFFFYSLIEVLLVDPLHHPL